MLHSRRRGAFHHVRVGLALIVASLPLDPPLHLGCQVWRHCVEDQVGNKDVFRQIAILAILAGPLHPRPTIGACGAAEDDPDR